MSYDFKFDFTDISRSFFRKIAKFSAEKGIHKDIGEFAESLVHRFDLQKATGVPVNDTIKVINDMMDIHANNLSQADNFEKAENRALFLPHCSRKYMDQNCKAEFDSKFSTYKCQHCSEDCSVNKADKLGKEEGYDVFILPGGSCISKILQKGTYDGIVGVACPDEIKLGRKYLKEKNIPYQGVPLLKNGCSNTKFNIETLKETLSDN